MKPILLVKNLNVAVEDRVLVKDLTFKVMPGTLTCITGENGVGKTTTVKTILKNYHKKSVVDFKIKRNQIQYVPQFRNVDNEFPLVVRDFVGLSLQKHLRPWLTNSEKQRLNQILNETHLTQIADEPLGEASGGEQQRAFLAQALLTDPQLLILDETTASLDMDAKVKLMDVVQHFIQKRQLAVLFITHDPTLIRRFGDYELHIENRRGQMSRLGGQE